MGQRGACLDMLLPIQHPSTAPVLLGCSSFAIRGQRRGSASAKEKRLGMWKEMWHYPSSSRAGKCQPRALQAGRCPGLLKDTSFSN